MTQPKHTQPDERAPERLLQVRTLTPGQSLTVGEEIEIAVLAVTGDRVRIALEAPRSTPAAHRVIGATP